MAFRPINIGTPNNNNGDSLYAGAVKYNENFTELYTALAGNSANTIRITLSDSGQVTGNSIQYRPSTGKFESGSSNALRTLGNAANHELFITDNSGVAGIDSELSGSPNTLHLRFNGRNILWARARTTSSAANTRAEMHYGMGNTNVTSLSVYTTGVTIRGLNGLDIYTASAEDTASYQQLLGSTSTGLILYLNPTLNTLRGPTDSSNSIAHTGFVKQNLINYINSSTAVSAGVGLTGGGTLSQSRSIGINPIYNPNHCDGFLYRYSSVANTIIITPGCATHYSFGTAGETPISDTSILSIVATSSTFTKTWATGGWSTGTTGRIIADSGSSTSTWYYIYLIANSSGYADFIATSQRTISGASGVAPAGFSIIRRIGAIKTDTSTAPIPIPFTTRRVAGNTIEMNWGKLSLAGAVSNIGTNGGYHTISVTSGLTQVTTSVAQAATTDSFYSSVLTSVPPIPGIEANLRVSIRFVDGAMYYNGAVYFYGWAWTSVATLNTVGPPQAVTTTEPDSSYNQTSLTTIVLSMSPDRDMMTESQVASSTIFPSSGQYLRHLQTQLITSAWQTYTAKSFKIETLGFKIAR